MTKPKQRLPAWYGCRPDTLDHRDKPFLSLRGEALPPSVDLAPHMPPVMDQGSLGSCVAHGVTAALRYELIVNGRPDVQLARLQSYYDARVIEGTVGEDSGVEIRDAIKAAAKLGVGHESLWPYKIAKFKQHPPAPVYKDALGFQALTYRRVTVSSRALRMALADGLPVIVGISVYESFESKAVEETGHVPMPKPKEELLGGHCMLVIGYGQQNGCFTARNSWGKSWGALGDCYIPYTYLGSPDFGADYWVIKSVG